jgi:hypothetical protein
MKHARSSTSSWPFRTSNKKPRSTWVPRGLKKQQAWGNRVACLLREVNRQVTYALITIRGTRPSRVPSTH